MNPYHSFVSRLAQLLDEFRRYPPAAVESHARPVTAADAPRVLLFSPHPDDECLTGVLPLRLAREAGMNVMNVAVTLGSRKDRRAARLEELKHACAYLGFGLIPTGPEGLERVTPLTRAQDPAHWRSCVETVAKILALYQPGVVFLPHAQDWHPTHIGTHLLVMDALSLQLPRFSCYVVETEYSCTMASPNLLVEASEVHVGELVTALSFHKGEVAQIRPREPAGVTTRQRPARRRACLRPRRGSA
ncbi:MAG: PIG-L family deacetylase [Verrucomicrobiales bacterium]|nr:PIG-L family deacetylase [Verrucomicrobiales bacterium]